MKVSRLTAVGWCVLPRIDRREQAPFTFDEIYAAAENKELVNLLLRIDEDGLIEMIIENPIARNEMEEALGNAASALQGRELRKTGIGDNALCMVMALVLEAIQQNSH